MQRACIQTTGASDAGTAAPHIPACLDLLEQRGGQVGVLVNHPLALCVGRELRAGACGQTSATPLAAVHCSSLASPFATCDPPTYHPPVSSGRLLTADMRLRVELFMMSLGSASGSMWLPVLRFSSSIAWGWKERLAQKCKL